MLGGIRRGLSFATPVGHLDAAGATHVAGWAYDPQSPDRSIKIEIRIGDGSTDHWADQARPDLAVLGLTHVNKGFSVRLTEAEAGRAAQPGETISIVMQGAREAELARFSVSETVAFSDAAVALLHPLAAAFRPTSGLDQVTTPAGVDHIPSKLVESAGAGPERSCSPYIRYVAAQLNVLDGLDRRGDPDHLFRWYLDSHASARLPQRALLSVSDIRYLNGSVVVGGKPFSISRAMFWYGLEAGLLADPAVLADGAAYRRLLYAWCRHIAPRLGVEDCLVTDLHISMLRDVAAGERDGVLPLSAFARIAAEQGADQEGARGFMDATDRINLYFRLFLTALHEPGILRFIPRAVVTRFLHDESPLLDRVARDVGARTGQDYGLTVSSYLDRLASRGFDVEAMRFTSVTPAGHRRTVQPKAPELLEPPVDVQVIGPLSRASGLGTAARASTTILSSTQLTANSYDFIEANPQPARGGERRENRLCRSRVNILHLNPDLLPIAYASLPNVFSDAYTIGFFFWELDRIVPCQQLAIDLVDEIWVSSEYNRATFAAASSKPVVNVGLCLPPGATPSRSAARQWLNKRFNLPDDAFVAYSAFDSFSYYGRKNPFTLIEMFVGALGEDTDAHLVIKTHNATSIPGQDWLALNEVAASTERVHLINETLASVELDQLSAGADCFASLHRSEGFGLGMLEAMHHGTPVMCTGYSGNMDFCTPETSWLVNFSKVPVAVGDYAYATGREVWAEPDLAHAIATLRALRDQPEERARRAEAARDAVERRYSVAAAASRYEARLREILSRQS